MIILHFHLQPQFIYELFRINFTYEVFFSHQFVSFFPFSFFFFFIADSAVNEAAKIIRLLHVTELRALQTRINEAIVAVQAITANPKTDQSLGRVGV